MFLRVKETVYLKERSCLEQSPHLNYDRHLEKHLDLEICLHVQTSFNIQNLVDLKDFRINCSGGNFNLKVRSTIRLWFFEFSLKRNLFSLDTGSYVSLGSTFRIFKTKRFFEVAPLNVLICFCY